MKVDSFFDPERMKRLFDARLSRKGFLRFLGLGALLALFPGRKRGLALAKSGETLPPRKGRKAVTDCDLAVARGEDPAAITRKAVETLGGMARFVKRGDVVVVKPNIAWDRTPEQAATTNPAVVAALVTLCRQAGAKSVRVFDFPCNNARRTYQNSGIADAVKKAGGMVYYVNDWKFFPGEYPAGSPMADWPMFRDAVECDCFINVPIAKHHGLTNLTLSMKNLMGVCGNRGQMHQDIDRKLVAATAFIKPDLTVIDAYRILLRHGPNGGKSADDVAKKNTVIAGADPVLADAYATTLFGMSPGDIGYIKLGAQAGLGSMNIAKARIREVRA